MNDIKNLRESTPSNGPRADEVIEMRGKMGDNLMMGRWQNRPGALFSIFCIFQLLKRHDH